MTTIDVSHYNQHIKYFQYLWPIAKAIEPVANCRLAACLVHRNEIISVGVNMKKSHPFMLRFSRHEDAIYLHAETDAIKNALKEYDEEFLRRCKLYVLRVKKPQEYSRHYVTGMAKPCIGCQRALATFNIKECYFSLDSDTPGVFNYGSL